MGPLRVKGVPVTATKSVASELRKLEPRVVEMVAEAAAAIIRAGHEPTLSCIARTAREDRRRGGTGIHVLSDPYWAADVVAVGPRAPDAIALAFLEVTRKWEYDPRRPGIPVAYVCAVGGLHLHVQACRATERKA